MLPPGLKLEQLLAPIDTDCFFRDRWEKEPLVVRRGDQAYYRGLFSRQDLDAMIYFSRPHFADLSALEPVAPRPATYLRGGLDDRPTPSFHEQPGLAELRQLYEQGKSVVIMAMQHRWPAVAELCRQLEAVFHCPVHANLYLTPPGSQGFAAHFDTHEVFVLQLDGTKQWRLFGAAEELPLASDSVPLSRRPTKPTQEVTLIAGDLLYLPRGHIHEASTSEVASLHLTVGVNVYRWADLLRHALLCLSRQDVEFRRSIPGGALPDDRNEFQRQFRALVERLASEATADGLFEQASDSLADQFFRQLKMLPGGQLDGRGEGDEIGLDTVVERDVLAICRVVENGQGVAIEFPGNRVGGPSRIASALKFMAGATQFAVRELPDDLGGEGKLVLV
ncbi:MAG TPA: cupin domain-containing protein, partial [Pirellulales bacterium]|nr:cupin domain-containing protein [Pirellulales bacterium]